MERLQDINYQQGMSNPVVIAMILGGAAVLAAMRGQNEASQHGAESNGRSIGVGNVLLASALTVGFLWALSYNGYVEAAWFFLLAPMALAGFEVFAVIDMLSGLARKPCLCPEQVSLLGGQ